MLTFFRNQILISQMFFFHTYKMTFVLFFLNISDFYESETFSFLDVYLTLDPVCFVVRMTMTAPRVRPAAAPLIAPRLWPSPAAFSR